MPACLLRYPKKVSLLFRQQDSFMRNASLLICLTSSADSAGLLIEVQAAENLKLRLKKYVSVAILQTNVFICLPRVHLICSLGRYPGLAELSFTQTFDEGQLAVSNLQNHWGQAPQKNTHNIS